MIRNYRDLQVWQRAIAWVEDIYASSRTFPTDEKFGITSQLRRAAVSVPCNIAEGAQRGRTKEFLQFLRVASGSLAETETLIVLAIRLGLLSRDRGDSILGNADEIGRMVTALRHSLAKRRQTPE